MMDRFDEVTTLIALVKGKRYTTTNFAKTRSKQSQNVTKETMYLCIY